MVRPPDAPAVPAGSGRYPTDQGQLTHACRKDTFEERDVFGLWDRIDAHAGRRRGELDRVLAQLTAGGIDVVPAAIRKAALPEPSEVEMHGPRGRSV